MESRPQPLLSPRRQSLEGRIAGVQRLSKASLGYDKLDKAPHALLQSHERRMVRGERLQRVGAVIDLLPENGGDEVGTPRKMAIHGADTDACAICDLTYRRIDPGRREDRLGRREKGVDAAPRYVRTTRPSTVSLDEIRAVWETNVFGVLSVYQAMSPLLRETPGSRIVNVSSTVGSLTKNANPDFPNRRIFGPVYPASKTALNAITLAMAIELEPEGIRVNAVAPGFTKTNLNGYTGAETVEQGAREAVRVALLGFDGPTGTFTGTDGAVIPW
jgi:NAD(P)-dependent dehydrogenase (short-subunit alcohol dehydrogenase family)